MPLTRGEWCRTATLTLPICLSIFLNGCSRVRSADTVATVNGRAIARSELDRLCNSPSNTNNRTLLVQSPEGCRLSALNELIVEEILQQQAEKMHLAATDDDIDSQLTEMKSPYTVEEFNDQLNRQGLTLKELRRQIGRDQSQQRLFNKEITSRIVVPDAEIAAYYHAHASEFNPPEPSFHLAKIVVSAEPDPARALAKIRFLIDLLYSGEDFATVAAQYSEDPETAPRGGDMEPVPDSSLRSYPAIYMAVSQRRPGQYTDPIPIQEPGSTTVARYVILRVIDVEAAGQHELADPRVQQSIRWKIGQRRSQLMRIAYLEMLRSHATIRNYFAEDFFSTDSPHN